MESKKLFDEITEAGYTLSTKSPHNYTLLVKGKTDIVATLNFGIGSMYGCCGGRILGGLMLTVSGNSDKKIIDLLIKAVFTQLWENQGTQSGYTSGRAKSAFTFMFVSNGHNGWAKIDKVLAKMEDLYTLCAKTTNPNTGVKLKTYVAIR